jgi:TonB family protein
MRVVCGIALFLALGWTPGYTQQPVQPVNLNQAGDKPAQKDLTPPKLIRSADAEYSDEARRRQISGVCIVSVTIDVQGMPQDVKIVRCTDPSFKANSLKAVKKYRFKPATKHDGRTPVPFTLDVEINYRMFGSGIHEHTPGLRFKYAFGSPPGMTSDKPDQDGVYPLAKTDPPPVIEEFSDEGFEGAAFPLPGNSVCDIALTISAEGKASDPQVVHCEKQILEKPAIASALHSHYKPGEVGGKAVPMRATLHLEVGSNSPSPQETSK